MRIISNTFLISALCLLACIPPLIRANERSTSVFHPTCAGDGKGVRSLRIRVRENGTKIGVNLATTNLIVHASDRNDFALLVNDDRKSPFSEPEVFATFMENGEELVVEVDFDADRSLLVAQLGSAKVELSVPVGWRGSVAVKGRDGNLELRDLELSETAIEWSTGKVRIENLRSTRISAAGVDAKYRFHGVRSERGEIKVGVGRLDAGMMEGSWQVDDVGAKVRFEAIEPFSDLSFSGKVGSLELTLPSAAAFRFTATTRLGSIRADDARSTLDAASLPKKRGEYSLERGLNGPRVSANSMSGNIMLHLR